MSRIHRIAGLRISRITPALDVRFEPAQGRDLLPDLEPADERLRRERSRIFGTDSITLSHNSAIEDVFDPGRRAEHRDTIARMTVYALNGIVMVFALPVGLALLFLNILGGENLRTTAHVVALTGLFLAIASTPDGAQILWMM